MSESLKDKHERGGLKALKDALKTTSLILKVSMVFLVFAFLFSGMTNLEQYEKAVVLRFGAEDDAVREKAGFQFALPYPVDQVIVVPAGRTQSLVSSTFMYQKNNRNTVSPFLKPGVDGYLLTSDGNVLHCESTMKYQVQDVSNFLFSCNADQRDEILKGLLDNAVFQAVAKLTLEEALNKKALIADSKLILQKSLDALETGVRVELLDLRLSVPRQVEADRLEVTKAKQDAARVKSEADVYVRKTSDLTESDVVKVKSNAVIWKTRMIGRAEADYKTFEKLLGEYRKDPKQVKSMLLRDAMAEISGNLEEVFVFTNNKERELRIMMPRKPLKKAEKTNGK